MTAETFVWLCISVAAAEDGLAASVMLEGVWRFGERCEVEVLSQTSSLYIHNKRIDLFVHLFSLHKQAQFNNGEQTAIVRNVLPLSLQFPQNEIVSFIHSASKYWLYIILLWRIIWKGLNRKRIVTYVLFSPGQRTQRQNKLIGCDFVILCRAKAKTTPEINSYLPSSHSVFYSRTERTREIIPDSFCGKCN